jgi:hypothetical protein
VREAEIEQAAEALVVALAACLASMGLSIEAAWACGGEKIRGHHPSRSSGAARQAHRHSRRQAVSDISHVIPVTLTATRIIRHGKVDDEAKAQALAEELHRIVHGYLNLLSVRPPDRYPLPDKFTKADMIDTILRTAIGMWSADEGAESVWIYEQFSRVDGDELYERYLRICDAINGTDIANLLDPQE